MSTCTETADCTDPNAPYCTTEGLCVPCNQAPLPTEADAACEALGSGHPLCVAGECVACTEQDSSTCDDQLMLCDARTNECVGCTDHGQCEAGACDAFVGRCFDPDNVLNVGEDQIFPTIETALDEVAMKGLDSAVLKLHSGTNVFEETATVNTGAVAFIAAMAQDPVWSIPSSNPVSILTVTGMDTRVYIAGVQLRDNTTGHGLSCDDGARVDVRRSQVVANETGSILVENGAELILRNSFVGGNVDGVDALAVNDATATILYSTIGGGGGNGSGGSASTALACDGMSTVIVHNSLLVARRNVTPPDDIQCTNATIVHSAVEPTLGGTNVDLEGMDTDWFIDYDIGDFHLTSNAPVEINTAALWTLGDPTTDIDGDSRPTMNGSPDFAGADVP